MSQSKWLKVLLIEEKQNLSHLILFGIWVSFCSLIIPIAVQMFVNTISFGLLFQPILILTVIVFSVLMISGCIRTVQISLTESLQRRIFVKFAMELAHRIPRIQHEKLIKSHGREWVNRFLDITYIQKGFAVLILDASAVLLQVVFGMLLLAFYHPFLLAINLIILTVSYIFFHRLVPQGREKCIASLHEKYAVVSWLQELGENGDSFRTRESRKYAIERTDQLTSHYLEKRGVFCAVVLKQIITGVVLQVLVSTLLLGVGGWLVVKGQLTLGQLVASQVVVAIVTEGIRKFGQYLESYYELNASLDYLSQVFDLPLERDDGEALPSNPAFFALKVKDLELRSRQGDQKLKRLSFEISAGSKVGLLVPKGTGRSRILRALYGLEEIHSGLIEIEGLDLRYCNLEEYRSKVAYIPAIRFYSGTLLDNLKTNNSGKSVYEIQNILEQLGIKDQVSLLENGLNKKIEGPEFPLPTPQSMKLMIARALAGNPKIILFDGVVEKTDWKEDVFLNRFLSNKASNLTSGITMIFVSRYSESLSFCDQIIRVEEEEGKGG